MNSREWKSLPKLEDLRVADVGGLVAIKTNGLMGWTYVGILARSMERWYRIM